MDKNEPGNEIENHPNVSLDRWNLRHFKSLMTLGKGNYATIYLVESLKTKELFAMKTRNKTYLQEDSEIDSIRAEKTVLLLAKRENHPFIVKVFGGFQTQSHIMLYLEFVQGGDLMHYLQSGDKFDLERTR